MCVCVCINYSYTLPIIYLEQIVTHGISGLMSKSILKYFKNYCQITLQKFPTLSHSYQQCIAMHIFTLPSNTELFKCFVIFLKVDF